jgi:hypothetical protein
MARVGSKSRTVATNPHPNRRPEGTRPCAPEEGLALGPETGRQTPFSPRTAGCHRPEGTRAAWPGMRGAGGRVTGFWTQTLASATRDS